MAQDPNAIIAQIFQQYLGRNPSDYELQGFAGAISQGIIDPIGISMFIQSTSEYQQKQIPQQAKAYSEQLLPALNAFSKSQMGEVYDTAQSKMAKQGRQDTSALGAQYMQAMQGLTGQNLGAYAQGLQNYLGGAYGNQTQQQQGYGALFPNAFNQYQGNKQAYQYQSSLADQQYRYDKEMADIARQQSTKNNWFQLGGSLLGAGGMALGGYLSGLNRVPSGGGK